MSNGDVYNLTELCASDFMMSTADKDFELTHEQLVKCVKILLYKYNLGQKKNSYERTEMTKLFGDKIGRVEDVTKHSLEEVNSFLHTIHADFESYLSKHKKEHVNMHMKQLKLAEDVGKVVETTSSCKKSIDQYATVLTCLVEFNLIEQALSQQDESDKNGMSLLAPKKTLKIPEMNTSIDAHIGSATPSGGNIDLMDPLRDTLGSISSGGAFKSRRATAATTATGFKGFMKNHDKNQILAKRNPILMQ